MSNIIKILPDSLANQIAAGEVIQRPASVLKELVENAIDAKATEITINIKDAGRTLIQVIDNGIGMSQDDARLSFERHATSKLKNTEDLFAINTKGFRGEALASIAAVAHVTLKTKDANSVMGTKIIIEGNELLEIEPENTPIGSNFSIKNLFYNIPARRKFLKSDNTELKHIITEFQRIAIPHFGVKFTLIHNDEIIMKLLEEGLKERILNVFDKNLNKQLVSIESDAGFVKIRGYIGKPETATKYNGKQYFFVNDRFMKNGYFHKAISLAYENLLAKDGKPSYFVFFDIDTNKIDVNIHPTKTEINFDDANSIFQILLSAARKALTDFDIPPAIDFDNTEFVNIKLSDNNHDISMPEIQLDPTYSFFGDTEKELDFHSHISKKIITTENPEIIFDEVNPDEPKHASKQFINLKNRYLITPVKSGLMTIHINRALRQIDFENILSKVSNESSSVQALYPIQVIFSNIDAIEFENIKDKLVDIGFRFEKINDKSYNIIGVPPYVELSESKEIILKFVKLSELSNVNFDGLRKEEIAMQIVKQKEKRLDHFMNETEMQELVNKLFLCKSHQYTYSGKPIINIIETEQLDNLF